MKISLTIIRATAEAYSLEELRALRRDAVQRMAAEPAAIISASTGGGASYTQQLQMTPAEAVEFYQLCIDYAEGQAERSQADVAQFATPVFLLVRR